jgi:antitoxin component of RelBE/YafQ-DinJ toxin-antitoxin module
MKNGGATIKRDNVIPFDNTTKSLNQLISKLKKSDMHFSKNLEKKENEIMKDLPGDFKRKSCT